MTITIDNTRIAPSWEALQTVIATALNLDGRLTRIARPDGQCNYRAHGLYHCTFTPDRGDAVQIMLTVS